MLRIKDRETRGELQGAVEVILIRQKGPGIATSSRCNPTTHVSGVSQGVNESRRTYSEPSGETARTTKYTNQQLNTVPKLTPRTLLLITSGSSRDTGEPFVDLG